MDKKTGSHVPIRCYCAALPRAVRAAVAAIGALPLIAIAAVRRLFGHTVDPERDWLDGLLGCFTFLCSCNLSEMRRRLRAEETAA